MSLKARFRISIIVVMTTLVLMQCVATLRYTIEDKFKEVQDRAEAIKEQTRLQVTQRVQDKIGAMRPVPTTFEATRAAVHEVVSSDSFLPEVFISSIVSSSGIVEIQLCDDEGLVLTSSSSRRSRRTYVSLPMFEDWVKRPLWDRIVEVLSETRDYVRVAKLAWPPDPAKRILDVRVVVSSLMIYEAIRKQVQTLAGFSALSLLLTVVFAYVFSNVLLNWLNRLSQRIESITTGEVTLPPLKAGVGEPKEFADMTSKIEVLGQQFRGARDDMVQMRKNIDGMLERLEEGVVLFDADRRVVRASRSAERILARKMTGHHLDELLPAGSALGALVRQAMDSGQAVREAPIAFECPGAEPLRLLANIDLLEEPGRRPSLLLTLRDVEGRRQLFSQLDISTRLAAISRLTGGVAHEIKNPLNAMSVHLELLKDKLDGEARVSNELNVIGGEIARLDRVVKTFLDFTRPVDLELKHVDLVDLVRQVTTLVHPGAEKGAVSVALDARVARAWARGDEDLIKQALINVFNNGVEAMPQGGRLGVTIDLEGDQVLVTVSDEGVGIPQELRERIFNLYFTTKEKGSGIGLAMTFRIVQLHSGTVDFSTEPGVGTTFRLRFPAAADPPPVPHSGGTDGTLGTKGTMQVAQAASGASAEAKGKWTD